MKLLVDDRWFGSTGIGRYAKEVLQRVPTGYEIDYLCKKWAIKNPISPFLLGYEINNRAPDLFWSPGFMPPMRSRHPYVVTVHDLIHLRYGSKLQIAYYNNVIKPLLNRAAYVLTVSEYSRSEILEWTGLPSEKVVAIYNAASDQYIYTGEKFDLGYEYLLYVGNKRHHKNLRRLLLAFSGADLNPELKLVFTGESTPELLKLAKQLNILNRLVFLGFVTEERLPSVYRGAVAVILVSLYEGFGIPILEGMACGVPVLTSNVTAMPEISGESAYLVDPTDTDEISQGLVNIVVNENLRQQLISQGKVRSQAFSWDITANKVWNAFSKIHV